MGLTNYNMNTVDVITYHTKVPDNIGMLIRLSQQFYLSVCQSETLWEYSLHSHLSLVKLASTHM